MNERTKSGKTLRLLVFAACHVALIVKFALRCCGVFFEMLIKHSSNEVLHEKR